MSDSPAPPTTIPRAIVVARESLGRRYEILARLGTGGMADVFLARAFGLADVDTLVALKRLRPDLRGDTRVRQMLRDEARLAVLLRHPNIVHTHDVGEAEAGIFIAMEYVDGDDVRSVLERTRAAGDSIPLALALHIGAAVAAALHHAHEQTDTHGIPLAIVHRDVSPANILLARHGAVKLIDFGIANARSARAPLPTGTLRGKVAYMSPEQVRGEALDRRADVFALGAVLYELVTLQRPFQGGGRIALMHQVCDAPHVPADRRRPDLPARLARLIDRALAKHPDARHPTALALLEDLEEVMHEERLHALPSALARWLGRTLGPPRTEPR